MFVRVIQTNVPGDLPVLIIYKLKLGSEPQPDRWYGATLPMKEALEVFENVPVKKKGWVNIKEGGYTGCIIHDTYQKARADHVGGPRLVATIEIEWEE